MLISLKKTIIVAIFISMSGYVFSNPNNEQKVPVINEKGANDTSNNFNNSKNKSVENESKINLWVSDNLTGHYHQGARSSKVKIYINDPSIRLFIDSPQAKFDCDLSFGPDGNPQMASDCTVVKYDAMGNVQEGWHWWTDDVVMFDCGFNPSMEICKGKFILHYAGYNQKEVDAYEPDMRVMRIERKL